MKKQICLLVEGLFDDIYAIEDEKNIDTEISDEYIVSYKAGDFYYQNKKPYAICCGDKEDFKDKTPRFVLMNYSFGPFKWSYKFIDIMCCNNKDDGYYNTSIIKRGKFQNKYTKENISFNISDYPAFTRCFRLGDNVYLPAIKELELLYNYYSLLNDILYKQNGSLLYSVFYYWSSTQVNTSHASYLYMKTGYAGSTLKNKSFSIRPFIKI